MKNVISLLTISLVIAVFAGVASADVYNWSFGSIAGLHGAGTFDTVTPVVGFSGLFQIEGATGTITDSTGTYSVSLAGLTANFGGVQGLCGNVLDTNAECNTIRGANGSGANYTFDNRLYTGASLAGGQPFDANGIAFVSNNYIHDNAAFLLTTTGWSGNGGGALYAGPEAVGGATLNTVFVPDGGMTIMLLGGALVGLETLRRKFRV